MKRSIRAALLVVCLEACLCACGESDFAQKEREKASGILGGLFAFISVWPPVVVYYSTLFNGAFSKHDIAVRHFIGIVGFLIAPAAITALVVKLGVSSWFWGLLNVAIAIGIAAYNAQALRQQRDSAIEQTRRAKETEEHQQASELRRLRANCASLPPSDEYLETFVAELKTLCEAKGLPAIPDGKTLYHDVVKELYELDIRAPNAFAPLSEMQRYDKPAALLTAFAKPLLAAILEFRRLVPAGSEPFQAPAHDVMDINALDRVLSAFTGSTVLEKRAHRGLLSSLQANWTRFSQSQLNNREFEAGKRIFPKAFEGTVKDAARVYFADTPLLRLFTARIPLGISGEIRFQHQWVVAPTGSGKTQLLQSQILSDLEEVKKGATLIIIDSQGMKPGKFLANAASLKIFAKGQPLDGKLVVLQPDPEHPLALNLFDMGQHDPSLSARDRHILQMSALKMVTFCLAGTTDQQQDMIEYLVQLAMAVPDATIDTVRRMLAVKKLAEFQVQYGDALRDVDETVRDYFEHSFFGSGNTQSVTKEAVLRRIMGMLRNPVFRKMYQNARNKFSMLQEIEAGKVIVINTDIELLGKEACELFGRFFIALLVQATQQRTGTMPVYCYIDECQDYIANDDNIASLLDKARKQKVGFILAHQRLANIISSNVLDALSNTAIKFAGGNVTDASTLAKQMRTEPEFIADQPVLSFAAFIRGKTPRALQVKIEPGRMEAMEKMTAEEQKELERDMRERYSVSVDDNSSPASPERRGSVTDIDFEEVIH